MSPDHSDRKMHRSFPGPGGTMAPLLPIFSPIILQLAPGSARKATPMGVPAPFSLFLYQKER